jgi:serine/threonine protein kinase
MELSGNTFRTLLEEACRRPEIAREWEIQAASSDARPWIGLRNNKARPPAQGWKLHVSANVVSAVDVLRRALPVLLNARVEFKVAATPELLLALNLGSLGDGQVGKFITVYPDDDAEAVRIATALDQATTGLAGPAVPSDRPLRPGSLVHYRYGGFAGQRYVQDRLGQVRPALSAPDGTLVPDLRLTKFAFPYWATSPFVPAATPAARTTRNLIIAGRYLTVAILYRSVRSSVRRVVDSESPAPLVAKQARRGSAVDWNGLDACDRLRHEAGILARLTPDPHFPRSVELVEQNEDVFLVMEDLGDLTLERYVAEQRGQSKPLPDARIVAWGRELAAAVGSMHARGLAYADLKSPNVMITPSGDLKLIDFELACSLDDGEGRQVEGTAGYLSPQRVAGAPPAVADDVFGLGALLYFMATGAEPSMAPNRLSLLDRPVEHLNPGIGMGLARVIARCLAPEVTRRYASMAAVAAALAELPTTAPPDTKSTRSPRPGSSAGLRRRYRERAGRLADSLCAAAEPAQDGDGLAWSSEHPVAEGAQARDINTGCAGTLLALAELTSEFETGEQRETLAQGARWLAQAPSLAPEPLPGLYIGEAGIGAALLRAGQVLDERELLALALERGRRVAAMPHSSPDLFHGSAGRLRFHLWLWDASGDAQQLDAALAAGEYLLRGTAEIRPGELSWRIPDGFPGLSGNAYLGYAHGAAGIADALLDLYEASGDARFLIAAQGAARWLERLAVPALADGSGLDWPETEAGHSRGALWCHGAAGIGRFFLHAAQLRATPGAGERAERAALTVVHGTRWLGPTQCHGLAGNVEFVLDMYRVTGRKAYLDDAQSLAGLLEVFARERDGHLVWPSETPDVVAPDFMVGYAGVAACLLRLSDPELRAHLLSRDAFRGPRSATSDRSVPLASR